MSRKKKIFARAGIVVVPGGVAFANFKFKKTDGITVNTEGIQRRLEAIVNASGKIQPKTLVNISADTSGRVTELAVNEGDRVAKGSSCSRSTRATCGRACRAARRVMPSRLQLGSWARDGSEQGRAAAGRRRRQAAARAVEAG
jgi:hypothetical protein